MFLEILIATALGIGAGIFTGLTPGIHVNLVSATLLSLSGWLLGFVDVVTLAVFIIAMAVVHTFLNAIPSIYLGAPDTAQVLTVLPGHRMLLRGRGYEAVKLTVIGSFWSLLVILAVAPLLLLVMGTLQNILQPFIGWLLVAVVLWMIYREEKRLVAGFLFLLSGVLGLIVLNIGIPQPLFPLLSGLFGLSTLIISLNEKAVIPPQRIQQRTFIQKRQVIASVGVASLVGGFVGFFPGLGSAQAAVIGTQLLNAENKNFLVLVGGIDTANMVMSLVTFYALDKARSGAIVAVRELLEVITFQHFVLFLVVALISGGLAVWLTLFFAKKFAQWMKLVRYEWLCVGVIALILVLVPVISGWAGVLVVIVSTLVGMIAPLANVSRSEAMGCLLLPVIIWFLV